MFSVALSIGSRRPGVTWHPALWSPDFPPKKDFFSDCLADILRAIVIARSLPCQSGSVVQLQLTAGNSFGR
jgi:hypothetical protein